MKNATKILILAVLLVSAPVTNAAAPKSITGTWKVESLKVDGKTTVGVLEFAKGAVWNLKKNGTATIGGNGGWKWEYDAGDREFVFKRPGIIWGETKYVCYVTSEGKGFKIRFTALLSEFEIVLMPD